MNHNLIYRVVSVVGFWSSVCCSVFASFVSDTIRNPKHAISVSYYRLQSVQSGMDVEVASIAYKRDIKKSAVIARMNYKTINRTTGDQYTIDYYPTLSKKAYAYASISLSNSPIYPSQSAAFHFYQGLPEGLEIEMGARWMRFSSVNNVYLITPGLAYYVGANLIRVKSYIIRGDVNKGIIYQGSIRRYLGSSKNFIEAKVANGNVNREYHLPTATLASYLNLGLQVDYQIHKSIGLQLEINRSISNSSTSEINQIQHSIQLGMTTTF